MALKNDECLPHDFIQGKANFHRASYHVVVPRRFSFADTLNPEWWRHASKIRTGDLIDLLGEAGDFDCTCRVVSADKGFVLLASTQRVARKRGKLSSLTLSENHTLLSPRPRLDAVCG